MGAKIELPEKEILDLYTSGPYWSIGRLAKKFKTTNYRITKLLKTKEVLRKTGNLEKSLIEKFLKYERRFDQKTVGQEMMFARKLVFKYPEEDFWTNFKLGFELNSLAFLLGEKGAPIVAKKYKEFKFEIPEVKGHNMSEDKIGEDLYTEVSKPKTIHDFMKT